MNPSSLYRTELWRIGLMAARVMPQALLERLAIGLTLAYSRANRGRRQIVTRNLRPVLDFDQEAAERTTHALFAQFGRKLSDLWRYEAGLEIGEPSVPEQTWNEFERIRSGGRGLILVTPHIGNWEFGAPFLRRRGVSLQVITQAEPQESLTALRKASRNRWGIDTLVIGQNPFAFVEVIRRLEQGAVIALLIDRPPKETAITIKLFGHAFAASPAAAELARASGAAILPTCLPRGPRGCEIQLLPPVLYERQALGTREARANLTQEIMKNFEPLIRRFADQWFHFVPVWGAVENPVSSAGVFGMQAARHD